MKNEQDLSELLEQWQRKNKAICLEGASGVEKFERLCEILGYDKTGAFIGASAILNFLSDNSGALETLLTWMGQRNETDWVEAVLDDLGEDGEDDEDDSEEGEDETPQKKSESWKPKE